MNYAKIENGVIVDNIVADDDFINSQIFKDNHPGVWIKIENNEGIGWTYDGETFSPPVVVTPPPVEDPCEWLIDLGPFYDRFGSAKMDVLTSSDASVKAILADVNVRKWIDLKRADVASALVLIGTAVPSVTSTLQNDILTTPVTTQENLALRKLYF